MHLSKLTHRRMNDDNELDGEPSIVETQEQVQLQPPSSSSPDGTTLVDDNELDGGPTVVETQEHEQKQMPLSSSSGDTAFEDDNERDGEPTSVEAQEQQQQKESSPSLSGETNPSGDSKIDGETSSVEREQQQEEPPSSSPSSEAVPLGDNEIFGETSVVEAQEDRQQQAPSSSSSQGTRVADELLELVRQQTSSDTYEVLSSIVAHIAKRGYSIDDIFKLKDIEWDELVPILDKKGIDFSDHRSIPKNAEDLDECIKLLSWLKSKYVKEGEPRKEIFTVRDITENVLIYRSTKANKKKLHRYNIGECLEVRGPSMRWRLEQIVNVVKKNKRNEYSDDDDATSDKYAWYEYVTAVDYKLTEREVRSPREGLQLIFGASPWIWRIWACVKLEEKLRFQAGHSDDLESLETCLYVKELWDCWLGHPKNESFRQLFDRVGPSGQEELLHHLMAPFELIDDIVTNRGDKWDFDSADISIFTYFSLLGSRYMDTLIVLFVQLAMPIVLFVYYSSIHGEAEIAFGTRPMLFACLLYYSYKVTNDVDAQFRDIAGIANTVTSRVESIRKEVWELGFDSFFQSLGYVVDMFMNTGYICYLYLFNMWILSKISDPFEMLGSMVALEFIFEFDVTTAAASWFDDDGSRYLKAGLVGLILQKYIPRDASPYMKRFFSTLIEDKKETVKDIMKRIAKDFKIDDQGDVCSVPSEDGERLYKANSGDDESSLHKLCTVAERLELLTRKNNKKLHHDSNYDEDTKPQVRFGGSFGGSDCPLFERHKDLRKWPQWEQVLFMVSPASILPDNYKPGTRLILEDQNMASQEAKSINPNSHKSGDERYYQFKRNVVIGKYMFKQYRNFFEMEEKKFHFLITRTLHCFFMWNSFVVEKVFPIAAVFALCYVFIRVCSEFGFDSPLFSIH